MHVLAQDSLDTLSKQDEPLLTPQFLLVTAITFFMFLGIGASVPLLPTFIKDVLSGNDAQVGISAAAFGLAAVLMRPFVGPLGDARGRRFLIVVGGIITAGGLIGQVAISTIFPLYLLRIIQGVGQGFFYVGAATLVADLAPSGRRGEAASYFSVALYAGIGVGPVAGDWIRNQWDYSAAWWAIGGVVAVAAIASLWLPERVAPVPRPDGTKSKFAPSLHPIGLAPGVILLLGTMPWIAFANYVPLHAENLGITNYPRAFAYYSATVIIVRIFGAKLPDRMSPRLMTTASLAMIALSMAALAILDSSSAPFIGAVLYGMGASLLYPTLMTQAVNSVPEHERSSVVATFTMFWDLGGLTGGLLFGVIAQQINYTGVFAAAMVIALMGIPVLHLWAMRRMERAQQDLIPTI